MKAMTKERFAKLHPYSQATVRSGRWCYAVSYTESASVRRFIEKVLPKAWVIGDAYGTICVTSQVAAEAVAKAIERRGGKATVARGKCSFDIRGLYDDQGFDFVEM